MDEKWICSNCGAENELKFCTKCGSPKPEEEAIPEVKVEDNSWNCSCGHEGNTGNFCRNCGLLKEQGAMLKMAEEAAAEPLAEAEAAAGVAAAAGTGNPHILRGGHVDWRDRGGDHRRWARG